MIAAATICLLASVGIFAVAAWIRRKDAELAARVSAALPQRTPRLHTEFEELLAFQAQARADIDGSGLEPIYELMLIEQARHELADDARIWERLA